VLEGRVRGMGQNGKINENAFKMKLMMIIISRKKIIIKIKIFLVWGRFK
jgi:hypothetical protein